MDLLAADRLDDRQKSRMCYAPDLPSRVGPMVNMTLHVRPTKPEELDSEEESDDNEHDSSSSGSGNNGSDSEDPGPDTADSDLEDNGPTQGGEIETDTEELGADNAGQEEEEDLRHARRRPGRPPAVLRLFSSPERPSRKRLPSPDSDDDSDVEVTISHRYSPEAGPSKPPRSTVVDAPDPLQTPKPSRRVLCLDLSDSEQDTLTSVPKLQPPSSPRTPRQHVSPAKRRRPPTPPDTSSSPSSSESDGVTTTPIKRARFRQHVTVIDDSESD